MNLLFLNWRDRLNPAAGGAEVITEAIMVELVRRGHSVVLFTASFPGAQPEEQRDGYTIIRCGSALTVHYQAWRWWRADGQARNFDRVVDQIHGIPFFTPLYMPASLRRAFIHEVPRSLWFLIACFPVNLLLYTVEPLLFWCYRRTRFLTVSASTKEDLVARGIARKAITIVPEAVDVTPLPSLPAKKPEWRLIFVGRHHPMKRIPHLLKMMQYLPEAHFDVVGRGGDVYVSQLKAQAEALGLAQRVTFHGAVPLSKRNQLMQAASLLVSASHKEGWGLIVTEANALGTPAVTYNVAGYRDSVKDGRTGWLAKVNTPLGLAEAVMQALGDSNEYAARRQAAWQDSKLYTIQHSADVFLAGLR